MRTALSWIPAARSAESPVHKCMSDADTGFALPTPDHPPIVLTRRKKIKLPRKTFPPYKGGPGISKKQEGILLKCFILDQTAAAAASLAKCHRNSANLFFRTIRERMMRSSLKTPRFFGDIEMDVSFFGGSNRKKVRAALKRLEGLPHDQYVARSREIRERLRFKVFGIMERGGKVYVRRIAREDSRTLMPLVRLVVEQGSTVYTDKWRGFSELGLDGYTHIGINHKIEYVDRKGRHINSIESFWSFCKRRFAHFNGIPRSTLPLHLKECEFRHNHRADLTKAVKSLLK